MGLFAAALFPILTLILLGLLLHRINFIERPLWDGIERLTYFILLPALLIERLASQNIESTPWPSILLVVLCGLIASALLLILWYRFQTNVSGATFTSIFQGGVRFNVYITLAVAQAIHGNEGLITGSIVVGFIILLINLLCVAAFAVWGNRSTGATPFIRSVVNNPLILACTIGWGLNFSGINLPGVALDTLAIIGSAALPLGLLAVGSALRPEKVGSHLQAITLTSAIQFGFKPLLVITLTTLLGLDEVITAVLLIAFMTPTAPSSYILARQLGGDTETMASLITFQTIIAFVMMPLLAALLL